MTLEEYIKQTERTISELCEDLNGDHSEKMLEGCKNILNEQKQLLEWLKELKEYKSEIKQAVHIGYREGVKDGVILELNSIREEIKEQQSNYTDRWIMGITDLKYGFYRAYEESLKLIDKHIAEIKGENK